MSTRGLVEIVAGRLDMAVVASWGTAPTLPPHISAHRLLHDPVVVALPDDHPHGRRCFARPPAVPGATARRIAGRDRGRSRRP
ncbi:hypothetical protein NGB36_20640 [Streptomyces sp. RB6PN25]|uniref:LysR substrate-binding domain-containing protein n=1 Tax=Streptomyces humicola TaxID=2953240 RepID=A0ABT1Q2J8_9ACTN|nr:hypothetical protein [Streptomyces humicola]